MNIALFIKGSSMPLMNSKVSIIGRTSEAGSILLLRDVCDCDSDHTLISISTKFGKHKFKLKISVEFVNGKIYPNPFQNGCYFK